MKHYQSATYILTDGYGVQFTAVPGAGGMQAIWSPKMPGKVKPRLRRAYQIALAHFGSELTSQLGQAVVVVDTLGCPS